MSGASLRKQMCEYSNFAASLGEQCEFRFLDGPRRCPPEKEAQMPARLKALLPPPYFEWWNARESDDGVVTYDGEEATLAHVTDFMRREGVTPHLLATAPASARLLASSAPLARPLCALMPPHFSAPPHSPVPGPFDGVLGFSQGGSLAHLLCMVQAHDKAREHAQSAVSVGAAACRLGRLGREASGWAALCAPEARPDPVGGPNRGHASRAVGRGRPAQGEKDGRRHAERIAALRAAPSPRDLVRGRLPSSLRRGEGWLELRLSPPRPTPCPPSASLSYSRRA